MTDTVARYRVLGEAETIMGRLGGEEFVILLPETSPPQALVVAERIRASIADLEFPPVSKDSASASPLHVTVSIGVAAIQPENDTLIGMLTHADEGLYLARKKGRIRVCGEV